MHSDDTTSEVASTLDRVMAQLDQLIIRGVRVVSAEDIAGLEVFASELEQVGAVQLAADLAAVAESMGDRSRQAAPALMRLQVRCRVFERLLTKGAITAKLTAS